MRDLKHEDKEKVYIALSSFLDGALKLPLNATPWGELNDSLAALKIPRSTIDVFTFWASGTLEYIHDKKFPYRVLHDMEKELISPEAYGFMLESIRLGFIETTQTEFLLEEMALKEHLPISHSVIQKTMIKNWFKTIHDSGIKKSQ
ncbi:MAG: hypothetical protein OCC49_03480 [Fibrobacterales bacterium]